MVEGRDVKYIGLTGGIATGKTTVSKYLKSKGIPVIDADQIVHQLLLADGLAADPILKHFGSSVFDLQGNIIRKKLGSVVFNDKDKLKVLNGIIHPLVRQETDKQLQKEINKGEEIIFNDVPLLFENNLQKNYYKTVLVYCSQETQLKRLTTRDNMTEEQAKNRISLQMSIDEKKSLADEVIVNEETLDELYSQIDEFIKKVR